MNQPKAYLVTASGNMLDDLNGEEENYICKISDKIILVDAESGYYLATELSKGLNQSYAAVPIYSDIIGNFTNEVKEWLSKRSITIRRSRS